MILLPLLGLLLTAGLARDACAQSTEPEVSWEQRPYRILCRVSLPASGGLGERWGETVITQIRSRISAVVGAPWQMTIEAMDRATALENAFSSNPVRPDPLHAPGNYDKIVLVSLRRGLSGSLELAAREWDGATEQWGSLRRKTVRQAGYVPAAIEQLLLRSFAPLARIESADRDAVRLRLRAGALVARDDSIRFAETGTIFLPVIRRSSRNSRNDDEVRVVPWTLIRVSGIEGSSATGDVLSGMRSPLSARRGGRLEPLAIALRPDPADTLLTVSSGGDPPQPLSGCEVIARAPGQEQSHAVGVTNHAGRVTIPAEPDAVTMLYVRQGGRYLAKLPLLAGYASETTVQVPFDTRRLEMEGWITAFQEDLVDVVARREVLVAQIEFELGKQNFARARTLMDRLKKLPSEFQLSQELQSQKTLFAGSPLADDPLVKRYFADTESIVRRQVDSQRIEELEARVIRSTTGL
jgi:hypothetical protein